jgi:hypothetical protein
MLFETCLLNDEAQYANFKRLIYKTKSTLKEMKNLVSLNN